MSIGSNIRNRRKELGMTQEELAEKMGYKSKSSINKIELGENDIPQSKVVKFAEVLHTTIPYIMGWQQEEIDAVSEVQEDAAEYIVSEEGILQNFMIEISEMGFDSSEIDLIRKYAHVVRELGIKNSFEFNKAFSNLFLEMYKLELSLEDLKEIYTYAQFLKSKQK